MVNSSSPGARPSLADHEVAAAAALAGAAAVRARYGGPLRRFDKGEGDFATDADVAAEQAILDVLRSARPEDTVYGEESGRHGAADAARQWLVDPLCGTLNYATGAMLAAVNVTLRDGAAAVADPFSGEVFVTDGGTAWVRNDGEESTLAPTAASRLVDLNLDPPFPSAPGFRAVELLSLSGFTEAFRPRVLSTSLAVAWVAAGRRAAYVTDGTGLIDSEHFAAGITLCRAAGCIVTGIDGAPLDAASPGLLAAADPTTHTRLLTLIRATA
ncbi:inositol monophosphatase family protein [Streptomyces triticagri]|uniref:Inositol monophosphatase family protein n=1 Tax=Streptomyces triticagri TaxID=2293568 RepID=A0A372M7A6_9ACTN|nr:inositol monophosphatase family protein [Streptomyces triticagri]RFU86838.1 inositol monophosphatase family protein [Streptomyces triticagri]